MYAGCVAAGHACMYAQAPDAQASASALTFPIYLPACGKGLLTIAWSAGHESIPVRKLLT